MKYIISICAVLLAATLPAPAQLVSSHSSAFSTETEKPVVQGRPVARVNGAVLTDRDLLREMYTIFPYARQHNGGFPKTMEADIRNGALKMIVFEELVYQEAERRKMAVASPRLAKAEADFRKQFHTPDQYQQFLKEECRGSRQVMRTKIRRSLLIEDLLKQEVGLKSAVTVAEAKAFYLKNPDKFRSPETFAVQTITILPPAKATAEQLKDARKRADDAIRQAKLTKNYEDFGLLAEKISEDDYRVMMGDHHAVEVSRLPAQVVEALRKMQTGQISDLIQVEQAFTIVRLNAHTPAGMKKFDEIKDVLRQSMQHNKTEAIRAGLSQRLRKNAKIEEL
jgi:peptidyl-prolyl cis-trans isomerase SurA